MTSEACRICLGDEENKTNPLISPCMCAGTMKTIHVDCLKQWLNSKRTQRIAHNISTYCWKQIECELCKMRLPFTVIHQDETISLLEYDKPKSHYYVLESVTA